jgi:hypothetical protein
VIGTAAYVSRKRLRHMIIIETLSIFDVPPITAAAYELECFLRAHRFFRSLAAPPHAQENSQLHGLIMATGNHSGSTISIWLYEIRSKSLEIGGWKSTSTVGASVANVRIVRPGISPFPTQRSIETRCSSRLRNPHRSQFKAQSS